MFICNVPLADVYNFESLSALLIGMDSIFTTFCIDTSIQH